MLADDVHLHVLPLVEVQSVAGSPADEGPEDLPQLRRETSRSQAPVASFSAPMSHHISPGFHLHPDSSDAPGPRAEEGPVGEDSSASSAVIILGLVENGLAGPNFLASRLDLHHCCASDGSALLLPCVLNTDDGFPSFSSPWGYSCLHYSLLDFGRAPTPI